MVSVTTAPTVGGIGDCYGTGCSSQDGSSFRSGDVGTAMVTAFSTDWIGAIPKRRSNVTMIASTCVLDPISAMEDTRSLCYTDYNPRILKGIKRGYQVAAGKIDKELLHRILAAILEDTYDMDEELKLDTSMPSADTEAATTQIAVQGQSAHSQSICPERRIRTGKTAWRHPRCHHAVLCQLLRTAGRRACRHTRKPQGPRAS